ncbi:MAG: ABC transporter permease [Gemmatimonadaceae bacterium]
MLSASRASVLQGLSATSANPLRTGLSTLGVVIGVASVITTLALADGLERYARDQIAAQTDVQAISVTSRTSVMRDGFSFPVGGYPVFELTDAADLQRHLASHGEVTLVAGGQAIVTSPHGAPHAATITATMANYPTFGHRVLASGRFFTDGEASRNAPIAVLSHLLAAELSPTGDPAMMIGRLVRIGGRPRTAIGVMPPYTGERGFQVIIPVRGAAATFVGSGPVTPNIVVRAASIETVDDVRGRVEEWLAGRYRRWTDRVTITTQLARLEQAQSAMLVLKLIMGALAGISLVVGGVGIMNVLLASVAERTREIGVRKALGARKRDILLQFLTESVTIAGVGSALGTSLGLTGAFTLAAMVRHFVPGAEMHAAVTGGTLLVAVFSAVLVGLTFGTFPALRASRLSPIDAIRHD